MLRKILHPGMYAPKIDLSLLIIRLLAGGVMLTHGIPKLQKLLAGPPVQFADPLGMGAETSIILAIFAEVFCALLIVLGLFTRLASLPLLSTMLIALFVVHWNDPFAKQELALIYGALYAILLLTGAGKYSLDNVIFQKQSK
ncbi:MAG: DoxX family protein [Weeksellaceae bacterium]|nr:DoxX family protein [Weeksellaceae bacterium]